MKKFFLLILIFSVGIQVSAQEFTLYPHPVVKKEVTVKSLDKMMSTQIDIIDITGMIVRSERYEATTSVLLNVEDLPNGRYMVRIYDEDQVLNTTTMIVAKE